MKESPTYQFMVKQAELTLVPTVKLAEDNLMVGSSNWEAHHPKRPSDIQETSPTFKPATKCMLLKTTVISSASPPTHSITLVSENP